MVMKMNFKNRRYYSLERKREFAAYSFIGLWIVGFLLFFGGPLIETVRYSFSELVTKNEGGSELLPLKDGIFSNYKFSILSDPKFIPILTESLKETALRVPTILVFSVFIALILNQDFKGKTFMRGIFFLPVIVTTGMISDIIRENLNNVAQGGGQTSTNIFQSTVMTEVLQNTALPDGIVKAITSLINTSVDTVWQSGVQILIFLSAILAIPASFYEVSAVEGATHWETFWKVTFPIIRPYILVNAVYTVIDVLSSYDNDTMKYIIDMIYSQGRFSLGTAMAWIYLLTILMVIGLIALLLKPRKERLN